MKSKDCTCPFVQQLCGTTLFSGTSDSMAVQLSRVIQNNLNYMYNTYTNMVLTNHKAEEGAACTIRPLFFKAKSLILSVATRAFIFTSNNRIAGRLYKSLLVFFALTAWLLQSTNLVIL